MGDDDLTPREADTLLAAVILDDEARQDPVPTYRRFHESLPSWRSASGMTVLTRYADGLEYLRNPKWGRSEPDMDTPRGFGAATPRVRNETHTMLLLNPPDHTRIRGLVSRAFTPRRVESLRHRIGALVAPLVDQLGETADVDLMASLAIPFPVAVISELLGVPQAETERFVGLARHATSLIDAAADDAATELGLGAVMEMAAYFVELSAHKRAEPDDGLLSALIDVESEGDRLSPEEMIANTILLYAAGFETTSNLIGNGMWALLRHPDQMKRLREDPGLLPSAIWEMLRYDSPVQLNARALLEDGSLLGRPASRGEQVMILQGAANHDPHVYEWPERFDVGRFSTDGVPLPLSFGWGAQHCLGAHLARAEAELVFGAILRSYGELEHVGPPPRYRASFTLRGLDDLRVSFR